MGVLLSKKLEPLGNVPNNVYQSILHPPSGATNIHTWSETERKWEKQNANREQMQLERLESKTSHKPKFDTVFDH